MSIFEAVLTQAAHRERKLNAARAQFEQSKAAELQEMVQALHVKELNASECNILLSKLSQESGMAMWSLNKYAKKGIIAAEKKSDPNACNKMRWYITQRIYDELMWRFENGVKITADLS